MKWSGLAGVVLLLMTASCGNDTARPSAPPGNANAGDPPAAAAVEPQAAGAPAEPQAAAAAAQPQGAVPPAEPGAAAMGTDGAEKPGSGQATAKPSAPVSVTASIQPSAADLNVVFGSDGTGITIQVWGVDGLKLTKGATPVSAASVKSGQSLKVSVAYDAPTTQSNLAIRVSGTFGGQEQAKVQSFTINAGGPPAKAPSGESKTDSDGRRVKVMKP